MRGEIQKKSCWCLVQIDATPFKQWFETHYGIALGKKKATGEEEETKKSRKVERKLAQRSGASNIESAVEHQFNAGRLYAAISSRPGQSGRCDGYILEGEELAFYKKKLEKKKKA